MTGLIVDIKRFAIHDGGGIRTTIFFKGCPLNCLWCHNPEGISYKTELAYYKHKCTNCGMCNNICDANTYNGKHNFIRRNCNLCQKCESICPNSAFKIYGKSVTVEQLLEKILEDKRFYDSSGGGVTLSGGECMMQADFCAELLKRCNDNGLNTAIDTCGFVERKEFDKVIPYTDTFLYDIKAFDEDVHIKCTGHSNNLILENLKYLCEQNCNIEIRIPFVPNYNINETHKIAEFLSTLKNISKVKILPYHNLTDTKYNALDKTNIDFKADIPLEKELVNASKIYERYGLTTITG